MLSTKKGQGLSLNTVIIAIIVLVVLVVLIMIFTGYFGKIFTPAVKACSTQGGQCASECTGNLGNEISAADCPTGTKCCASVNTQYQQRQEGVASCQTQTGSAKAKCVTLGQKPDPSDPAKKISETCADKNGVGSTSYSAPGACSAGQTCCT